MEEKTYTVYVDFDGVHNVEQVFPTKFDLTFDCINCAISLKCGSCGEICEGKVEVIKDTYGVAAEIKFKGNFTLKTRELKDEDVEWYGTTITDREFHFKTENGGFWSMDHKAKDDEDAESLEKAVHDRLWVLNNPAQPEIDEQDSDEGAESDEPENDEAAASEEAAEGDDGEGDENAEGGDFWMVPEVDIMNAEVDESNSDSDDDGDGNGDDDEDGDGNGDDDGDGDGNGDDDGDGDGDDDGDGNSDDDGDGDGNGDDDGDGDGNGDDDGDGDGDDDGDGNGEDYSWFTCLHLYID
ncbi:hypothetical protein L1887_03257 [Cichorium endivia]|nr:hypothetical protein L1887_03257 [Cichorium endivia]